MEESEQKRLELRINELEEELNALKAHFNREKEAHEFVKASLAENEERLRNVLASVPVIICILDEEFRITYIAGRAVQDLRLNPKKILNRCIIDLLELDEGVENRLGSVLHGNSYERMIQIKGHWMEVAVSPYKLDDSSINTMIAVASDVTQRVEAYENQINREKLEGILEVAGAISHELNQPLQIITTAAEFMKLKDDENGVIQKNLSYILESVERMVTIIDRLKKLTRYETMRYTEKTVVLDILKASEKRDD